MMLPSLASSFDRKSLPDRKPIRRACCTAASRGLMLPFQMQAIQAFAHFLAGLEEGYGFLVYGHMGPGSRIAARPGAPVLDGESPESAQFHAVSAGQRSHDLTQDGVDDILHVTLVKVGILSRNTLDKL
jgi:hypothetical protein